MNPIKSFTLVFFGLALLLVNACKKNSAYKDLVLKGQLLDNCTGTPLSNVTVELWQNLIKKTSAFDVDKPAYKISSTTTDNNGFFEFKQEFNTANQPNYPRDGSIRVSSIGTVATGLFDISTDRNERDLGILYKNMDKVVPLVFMNNLNYEPGDKILVSKQNDLSLYDTLNVTSSNNQWIINHPVRLTTKQFLYDQNGVESQRFIGLIGVQWDFKNNPDQHTSNFYIHTSDCNSQDSIYVQWW